MTNARNKEILNRLSFKMFGKCVKGLNDKQKNKLKDLVVGGV